MGPAGEQQTRHKPGSDQALPLSVSRLQEAVHPSQPVAISPAGCPHPSSLQLSLHSASNILVSHDLKFYLIDRKHFQIIFLSKKPIWGTDDAKFCFSVDYLIKACFMLNTEGYSEGHSVPPLGSSGEPRIWCVTSLSKL